jgi:N-sulfoglucosamine sulfohydrolase
MPERSLLPILEETDPTGWDEVYYSHCFHEVTNYFPYRALRGRQYKFVRHLAHQLPTPLPSDLFRSPTWQAVRQRGIEMLGQRPTRHFLHREPEELYDIQADPTESHNLIHDPRHAEVAAEMRRKVMEFRVRTRDPWLEQSIQEGEEGAARGRTPQP